MSKEESNLAVNFIHEQQRHLCLAKVKQHVILKKKQKLDETDLMISFKGSYSSTFFNFWGGDRNELAGKMITLSKLTHLTFWLWSKALLLATFSAFSTFEGMRLPKAAGEKGWTKAVSSLGSGDRQRLSGCFLYIPFKGCCALALRWFFKESKCIAHLSCSSA